VLIGEAGKLAGIPGVLIHWSGRPRDPPLLFRGLACWCAVGYHVCSDQFSLLWNVIR
jgi:hypothetical protein